MYPERRQGSTKVPGHDSVLCSFSKRSAPDRGKWCGVGAQNL
jgi:hypothetical protein